MLTILLVLAVVTFAGYVAGFRVGRQRRPYWSAPPTAGYVVEVFEAGGQTFWQSVRARETADSLAESWCFPGYAVATYGPGDYKRRVVYGEELLEEWEAMWPIDPPPTLRRAR